MSDLISRQDAIKAIDDLQNCYNGYSDTYDKAYIIGVLEDVPSVDVPDRKVGKWIYGESESGHDGYYCSQCGEHIRWRYGEEDIDFIKSYNYCPNCGVQMRGERRKDDNK